MGKLITNIKEWMQYIGVIGIALFSALILVIKMAVMGERKR